MIQKNEGIEKQFSMPSTISYKITNFNLKIKSRDNYLQQKQKPIWFSEYNNIGIIYALNKILKQSKYLY